MNEIANQLAILNDQLANQAMRKKRTGRRVLIAIASVVAGLILLFAIYLGALIAYRTHVAKNTNYYKTVVECELNGTKYGYEMVYDDNYLVRAEGGDAFISNHVDLDNYNDFNEQLAHIEDYFTEHGGTCIVTEDRVPVASVND